MIPRRLIVAGISVFALAGCIPLAGSYVHLEAPGIRHAQGICRDVGPPAIAAWESEGLRFEMILQPLFESNRAGSDVRVRVRRDVDVHFSESQGRLFQRDGETMKETRFRLEPREEARSIFAPDPGPTDFGWRIFAMQRLPLFESSGRVELPAIVVGGRTIAMPVFEFEVRPWATFAPLNC